MSTWLGDELRERGSRVVGKIGDSYRWWVSIPLPMGYDEVRAHADRNAHVDIWVDENGTVAEDLDGEDAVAELDRLTREGEAVESVDFTYRGGQFSRGFDAQLEVQEEPGEDVYTVGVEARGYTS